MARPDPRAAFFLERQAYRRRRIGDAARMLPVLGAVLMALPLVWVGRAGLGSTMIYLFAVWAGLIALAALISRLIGPSRDSDEPRPPKAADDLP